MMAKDYDDPRGGPSQVSENPMLMQGHPQVQQRTLPLVEHLTYLDRLEHVEDHIAKMTNALQFQQQRMTNLEQKSNQQVSDAAMNAAIRLSKGEMEHLVKETVGGLSKSVEEKFATRESTEKITKEMSAVVQWNQFRALADRVSAIRNSIDATAESVFTGHRDTLLRKFDKKADAQAVDIALRHKAEASEVARLRERADRVEAVASSHQTAVDTRFEQMREGLLEMVRNEVGKLADKVERNSKVAQTLWEACGFGGSNAKDYVGQNTLTNKTNTLLGKMQAGEKRQTSMESLQASLQSQLVDLKKRAGE
uniref:Uncharacterized protein n=1 Tax=Chromera velia CCMP2878 TaxID=1169474 RepID=A0A0G4HCC8_9ALVE|eukprot:Cvel_26165.t1-p1 / transcript=Cvel_26165.t1 / gene=Cvel_26165 / organism=Chromera_velia_CCMP2878 / gene_product=hypothetical protein / transcript_product=hypothetical protein / location=Cvel_scaffold3073:11678-14244(-) / protein_length=308 / sequence_SO=supercontig / SO=protein_coding / is_pseudo=false